MTVNRIIVGDCMDALRGMGGGSVQTCVTSPPYFGLRDYGVAGQIGLEPSPGEYVERLVEVFREVRRVLADDGTLWLNLGDSYAGSGRGLGDVKTENRGNHASRGVGGSSEPAGFHEAARQAGSIGRAWIKPPEGLKQKDLIGIPWRVAFALQADGWYLRQDIIWHKPNPMPESVRDRCTKAHEYLFLLSKSARYYFDQNAISEPLAEASIERLSQPTIEQQAGSDRVPGKTNGPMKAVGPRIGGNKYGDDDRAESRTKSGNEWTGASKRYSFAREAKDTAGEHGQKPQHRPDREDIAYYGRRNKRSVWEVATQPFKEAHFATFPPALIEPCILAGSRAGDVVLDPFIGAGTTGLVAQRLGRRWIGCELNPEYAAMAERRIAGETLGLPLEAA